MKKNKVDIVIPVYNEEDCLEKSILVLYNFLKEEFGHFNWNIIIADNASTDKTSLIATQLSNKYTQINYFYLSLKGRGLALRKTFLNSVADVVCYMDVDLSTNLKYLNLLFEGINCGFDISIGTRLKRASRVKRRFGREVVSRIYNILIKILFFNNFSDAQCGFKAIKTDVAKQLIPLVKNNNWFFDTELLLLAEYNKFRIFEVPVEWIEDLNTKVHITKTIMEDIKGLFRVRFTIHKISKLIQE